MHSNTWKSDVEYFRQCLQGLAGTITERGYQFAAVQSSFPAATVRTTSSVLLRQEEHPRVNTTTRLALASASVLHRRRNREQESSAGSSLSLPNQELAEAVVAEVLTHDSAFIDAYYVAAERQRLTTEGDSLYGQIDRPISLPVSRITHPTIVSLWDQLLQCQGFDPGNCLTSLKMS